MRTIFLGALLASTMAVPALAQDATPFTGPRVEGVLGYDRLSAGSDADEAADGLLYGGAIGYDVQLGGIILGAEGEFTDTTTRVRGIDVLATGDSVSLRSGRDLYAGARLGFVVSPKTMIYAKGGYTNARFKFGYVDPAGAVTDVGFNADGYRVGAGIEHALSPSTFVKAEYRYSNYSEIDSATTGNVQIDTDRHQGLVGFGVRF